MLFAAAAALADARLRDALTFAVVLARAGERRGLAVRLGFVDLAATLLAGAFLAFAGFPALARFGLASADAPAALAAGFAFFGGLFALALRGCAPFTGCAPEVTS